MYWGVKLSALDVWMLRGNRLFGGPGDHGEALFPPRPSLVAGAAASAALAASGRIREATAHPDRAPQIVQELFGDRFRLRAIALEHEGDLWLPAPADLVAFKRDESKLCIETEEEEQGDDEIVFAGLAPSSWPEGVRTQLQQLLPMAAVLKSPSRKKPLGAFWLRLEALAAWLKEGELPTKKDVRPANDFFCREARLGIALDDEAGRPQKGRIYTTEAIRLQFWKEERLRETHVVAVFDVGKVPSGLDAMLWRFGGDGRAATVQALNEATCKKLVNLGRPDPKWKRVRMIAAQPIASSAGWLPPGAENDGAAPFLLLPSGVRAEIKAASLPRAEVLSGWDLAEHQPKKAVRAVPAGSCWWLELEREDAEGLEELWEEGVYSLAPQDASLRGEQEGIGAVWFGVWNDETKEG